MEEGEAVRLPPQDALEEIAQAAERGEFTRVERILNGLEAEDGAYNAFCRKIREYARKYDEEGIVKYLPDAVGALRPVPERRMA